MNNNPLGYIAFVSSVIATYILSYTNEYMVLVFALYLIGNICWIIAAIQSRVLPVLLQNLLFLPPALYGIWNYIS